MLFTKTCKIGEHVRSPTMSAKIKALAGAFLILAAVSMHAKESNDAVLARFSKVGAFAFGGIGFAGVTSEGEKDFRNILASSSAQAQFEQLYATGNLQAKAYALVGIRRLDMRRYNELSTPLRDISQPVTVFRRCIMSHELFSSLLKSIDDGAYDVKK